VRQLITIILQIYFIVSNNSIITAFTFYDDINLDYKYFESIQYLTNQDIVSGYDDNTFKPLNLINRAELLKIVVEAVHPESNFNLLNIEKKCFDDLQDDNWFNPYVCYAKGKQYISGYENNTFKPNQTVKLVEALKIVLELFEIDYQKTDPWYKGIVEKSSKLKILPQDFIYFEQNVTRAQMAEIVARVIKYKTGIFEGNEQEISTTNYYSLGSMNYYSFDPLNQQETQTIKAEAQINIPFTSQAPFNNWALPYDEACEEAALIMINYYLNNLDLTKEISNTEIVDMVNYEEEIGFAIDITIEQLAEIAINYYGLKATIYKEDEVTIDNIKNILNQGHPVIVPCSELELQNPNYYARYHMLVITGYNETEFITNDPGTSRGQNYKYNQETLLDAIHNWIGHKDTVRQGEKAMLILDK